MFANKWFCLSVCLCMYGTIYLQMYSIFISNEWFLILIIWGVRRPKYITINYTWSLQGSLRICQGNFREFSGKKICARVWEPWSMKAYRMIVEKWSYEARSEQFLRTVIFFFFFNYVFVYGFRQVLIRSAGRFYFVGALLFCDNLQTHMGALLLGKALLIGTLW